jgi:hypothetical protein
VKTVAVVAAGLALVAAGCFGGGDSDEPLGRKPPQLFQSTDVSGGPRLERTLLRLAVRAMSPSTLRGVTIRPLAVRRRADPQAEVEIDFDVPRRPTVRRGWDAMMVGGGFSRRLLAAGRPAVVDTEAPEGGFIAKPRVQREPDPRPLPPVEEAALMSRVRGAVEASGAEIARLQLGRPYGPALALVLSVDDPASFLENDLGLLLRRLGLFRPRLEGLYIGVLDGDGRLVLEVGTWTRNPVSRYWVRRDLEACSPVVHFSHLEGAPPPPPCPT